jgi:hypothetical protein
MGYGAKSGCALCAVTQFCPERRIKRLAMGKRQNHLAQRKITLNSYKNLLHPLKRDNE